MNESIFIKFGVPQYGWLPVTIRHNDFELIFGASDALNDPIEELYNAIIDLRHNDFKQVIWWLEPAAYFFDIEKKGDEIVLTISQTGYLRNSNPDRIVVQLLSGSSKQIIRPLLNALKEFVSHEYEERHWPYKLGEKKLATLKRYKI